jgi:nitroreductase
MEFNEVIQKRESVRNYDPTRKVPREVLDRILEAGRIAPSAANYQPWEFWLISTPEMLEKVHPCYSRQWFRDAPHILVVTGDLDQGWVRDDGYNSLQTDLAIALHQMVLAATNEGIGSCWITNFKPDILRQALGLKNTIQVFGITPLGYPRADFVSRTAIMRKPLHEVVIYK